MTTITKTRTELSRLWFWGPQSRCSFDRIGRAGTNEAIMRSTRTTCRRKTPELLGAINDRPGRALRIHTPFTWIGGDRRSVDVQRRDARDEDGLNRDQPSHGGNRFGSVALVRERYARLECDYCARRLLVRCNAYACIRTARHSNTINRNRSIYRVTCTDKTRIREPYRI